MSEERDPRVPENPADRQIGLVRIPATLFTRGGMQVLDLGILPSAVGEEGGAKEDATRGVIVVLAPPSVGETIDAQTLTPLLLLHLDTIVGVIELLQSARDKARALNPDELKRTHVVAGPKVDG